jgi:hypothetical protein
VRARSAALLVALLAVVSASASCGASASGSGPDPAVDPSLGSAPVTASAAPILSGFPIERFFPIVDGYIYSYETMSEAGDKGVLITRAARVSPRAGELRSGTSARRFSYTEEGVLSDATGAFILKEPLAVGASWRGEHGGVTRITSIDKAAFVPAGRFTGCVETVEERRGDRPVRYATTFCPGVGVVALEAEAGAALERAELKSYAPPVTLGPDGVTLTKP